MLKLDVKDKKLLYEIDFDARKTYAELAKKLQMSKRGVEYKLVNLEKRRVILGYVPVFDLTKFGYYYFRLFVKFQSLTKSFRKEVKEYVRSDPDIGWVLWANDAYDIGIAIWAKSVFDFKRIVNRFYSIFDSHIKERSESVATEVAFFKNRFLIDNHSIEQISIGEKKEAVDLDVLDKKLLNMLVINPRRSIVDLADSLGESPQRTSYRFKRLKSEGILLGIRPILNYSGLGRLYYKLYIDLNNAHEVKLKELEDFVAKDSRTVYIVKALGTCDFDVEIIMSSPQELFEFIESVQEKFPGMIRNYRTLIFGETVKAKFLPF